MMLNRIHRVLVLLFVIGFLATYFCDTVYCESTPASRELTLFNLARGSVREVEVKMFYRKLPLIHLQETCKS